MYEELRNSVCGANLLLVKYNLMTFTWGNVSGIDRKAGIIVIKPSGVAYEELRPEKMVVLDLNGKIVEGELRPSSDTPTHLELYRNFKDIGGICHTHSPKATSWAQACREIPCFGTTHADHFYGAVPVTEKMSEEQIKNDYELNTGKVIVKRFNNIDPLRMQAVLVANHGPFTWGTDAEKAVENAVVLEQVADMALGTVVINAKQKAITQTLLDKHFLRKHGKDAYYGQK
ncbi:MAG: L-ribulose-5-phosphate 4-epimerase [Phycisphaerae bacterium]|jgi:L-ribulose-5-phosphate 4-epimerase